MGTVITGNLHKYTISNDANANVVIAAAAVGFKYIVKRIHYMIDADTAGTDLQINGGTTVLEEFGQDFKTGAHYGYNHLDSKDDKCDQTTMNESLNIDKPAIAGSLSVWYKKV